ncbi:unnamed protein product, partial [Prorocentrum cordatum]
AAPAIAQSLIVRPEDTAGAVKERAARGARARGGAAGRAPLLRRQGAPRRDEARRRRGQGGRLLRPRGRGLGGGDFAQQLAELLQAQVLPLEELGLLYSHRHGATTGNVLKLLGRDETLSQFLQGSKQFVVEAGRVRSAAAAGRPAEAALLRIVEDEETPRAEGTK